LREHGHLCKNLAGKYVPWSWKDCLCNPNLMAEIEAEEQEEAELQEDD